MRPNESNILTTKRKKEAKNLLKLTIEAQKDPADKQSNRKLKLLIIPPLLKQFHNSKVKSTKDYQNIQKRK